MRHSVNLRIYIYIVVIKVTFKACIKVAGEASFRMLKIAHSRCHTRGDGRIDKVAGSTNFWM